MKPKLLLLQVRDADDPILTQEIEAFAWAAGVESSQIATFNLLEGTPSRVLIESCHAILIGGSGNYSATVDSAWLSRTCDLFRDLRVARKPTFGSCWGFQALAKDFGGTVVHDHRLAELGTLPVRLTPAGFSDPVFGPLGSPFFAPLGHEDSVTDLPTNCSLLGRTEAAYQIFRCDDAPIYGTQFHPELTRKTYLERVRRYPKYIEQIRDMPYETFAQECVDTPHMVEILPRFLRWALT